MNRVGMSMVALLAFATAAPGQYFEWQAVTDPSGLAWAAQTHEQALAALGVELEVVRQGVAAARDIPEASLGEMWLLQAQGETAFAWTRQEWEPLRLFRSDDGGRTWTPV
jgi:hypothetical protein